MYRKISVLLLMCISLLLTACVEGDSTTFVFSGDSDKWSAELEVTQIGADDDEIQDFVLAYKGNNVDSIGEISYKVTSIGGFSRNDVTLEKDGTFEDSIKKNPSSIKVNENTEFKVTVEWQGNTETFKLDLDTKNEITQKE